MAWQLLLGHPGGCEHYGLFVVHNQLPKWVRTLSLFVVRCLICLFVACVTCLWLGCVMCLFLVCVLFLFLVCVMCLCTLASLRSAGARFARCGRFAAAAAASRPPGTTVCLVAWLNPRDKGKRLSPQPGNRACLVAWLPGCLATGQVLINPQD